jgi:hypothetical protein
MPSADLNGPEMGMPGSGRQTVSAGFTAAWSASMRVLLTSSMAVSLRVARSPQLHGARAPRSGRPPAGLEYAHRCLHTESPAVLIAGNTLVVRAADEAPLTTLYLSRLVQEAGFPPGVINIVSGLGPKTGAYLVGHPGVDGVSFTGSVPTGRAIATTAAKSFKRTVLELGGKCPFLICEDADMEEAVQRAVRCLWFSGTGM